MSGSTRPDVGDGDGEGTLRAAYEAWVRDFAPDLYRFAFRLTGNRELADELLQVTFLQAWQARHTLRDASAARGWLFTILRHAFHQELRRRSARPDLVEFCSVRAAGTDVEANNVDFASKERSHVERITDDDALQHGLNALDEYVRLPFVMVFVEGKSCRETADALGIPLGTVLSRLSRARVVLRAKLGKLYEVSPPCV